MTAAMMGHIQELIQEDVGNRGLRTVPERNLVSSCAGDLEKACRSLAGRPGAGIGIVTGFLIPHANPPCGETDGPLGAIFLARALVPLGMKVTLITDGFAERALQIGLRASGLEEQVLVHTLPPAQIELDGSHYRGWFGRLRHEIPLTHLIALERVGPSHTTASMKSQPGTTTEIVELFEQEVPIDDRDRCRTMRGIDISTLMSSAHLLFEMATSVSPKIETIGIGDGGNEIGMGKIPWDIIRRNIPRGGLLACRVPTDHLIVCGISNWGAYGLAAGVRLLRGSSLDRDLFNPQVEFEILRTMVEGGPLVDGTTGLPTLTVDGLSFERYSQILTQLQII